MVRIALTGTPGVGKTTLARAAQERYGWRVVDVKAFAHEAGCVTGRIGRGADAADEVDTARLARRVPPDDGTTTLYEGHLSHHLGLDVAWVVRCDPEVLRGRLAARGYSPAKVRENLEAEAIDLILQEALDATPRVVQRDGTRRTPEALLQAFAENGTAALKGHDLEPVDWSDRLDGLLRG